MSATQMSMLISLQATLVITAATIITLIILALAALSER